MRVVLIGPLGAGKSTQALSICREFGIPHVSTGEMLRQQVRRAKASGGEAERHLNAGSLVPDDFVCRVVKERLAAPDCQSGFLLDGYPRSIPQALDLSSYENSRCRPLTAAVLLTLDNDEIVARLANRRVCSHCAIGYHLVHSPPAVEGCCDACEGQLLLRPDDAKLKIRHRLLVYHQQSEAVIEYYRSRALLIVVSAIGSIRSVGDKIMSCLRSLEKGALL